MFPRRFSPTGIIGSSIHYSTTMDLFMTGVSLLSDSDSDIIGLL